MFKLLRLLGLLAGGVTIGFALAILFQWTCSISYHHASTTEVTEFRLDAQPYHEVPTFDIFKEDQKK